MQYLIESEVDKLREELDRLGEEIVKLYGYIADDPDMVPLWVLRKAVTACGRAHAAMEDI